VSAARLTPRVDRWKKKLARALDERGAKAELARWLTAQYGSTFGRWQVQIAQILNTPQVPDGEFLLAVEAFLQK
jgi:hypothetical protein